MSRNLSTNQRDPGNRSARIALGLVLLAAVWLTGCSTPIGANKIPARQSYGESTRNALSADCYSGETRLVLNRFGLEREFKKSPETALTKLNAHACADGRRNLLYALSELNYLHAERLKRSWFAAKQRAAPDRFFESALYAYLYLFGEGQEPPPGSFDRRFRVACDLYNRALAQALCNRSGEIQFRAGPRVLATGPVEVQVAPTAFSQNLGDFERFLPADDYKIYGLALRDRRSGLGSPLIGIATKTKDRYIPQHLSATVFLRVTGDVKDWNAGRLTASLELHAPGDNPAQAGGVSVPLQLDETAPLAYALQDNTIWKLGMAQFFSAEEKVKSDVYLPEPYVPGRIPVIFVHGTFSSPVWWADTWNTLRADPKLRERCQFWYFIYNSGKPITASAAHLQASILAKIKQLDPEGKDPALRQMVVIGHSQGGLLAKLTVTDTGDELWRTVTDKPFDTVKVSPEMRQLLKDNLFFTPLPCVKRVVFMATPHRGSYRATSLVRKVTRWFTQPPKHLALSSLELLKLTQELKLPPEVRAVVPTSVDGMSPKNPWLLALAGLPPAPGVKAHSIVAIKGDQQPPEGGDGVVKYRSAHVDYAESEFIVRSSHTCQNKPLAIEEVRRILLQHLAEHSVAETKPSS